MSEHTISIPNSLYEKAQRLAKQTSQSVDEIICTRLEGALDQTLLDFPSDERAELHAMSYLSTDALWTIAREQMQLDLQHAMSQLMEKNSKGTITEEEFRDLSALVWTWPHETGSSAGSVLCVMQRHTTPVAGGDPAASGHTHCA